MNYRLLVSVSAGLPNVQRNLQINFLQSIFYDNRSCRALLINCYLLVLSEQRSSECIIQLGWYLYPETLILNLPYFFLGTFQFIDILHNLILIVNGVHIFVFVLYLTVASWSSWW